MSEMSAEKKKEIEKYIIKSYFGGGKNVESLANGADTIKGTDDGYIPQLIVEVTYFGESGVVMIKWNIYGDSQQNSFAMRVCREREIEQNRCDSVDAMSYAWEAWKSKIQGKPIFLKTNDEDLQKDKRSEELEKEVKALRAEKEVMDRHIHELESHNVSLAETNAVLNNKLNKFDPMPEFKELLKKLYSTDDVEKLAWTLNHVCGGRGSVNGWIAVSSFWKQNYETLSKLVGFSSVEEIQDYLTNEVDCDTLHEAIHKLIDENKYVCEEWCKAGELIEKWRKATGCLRPEDISIESMISKSMANEITAANENIWRENEKCEKIIEALLSEIREWLETTGCPSPSSAKTLIESGMSYEHGYHEVQEENRKLTEEVDSWKNVTGYSTPEDYMHARINCATPFDYTAAWQYATGCVTPDQAKSRIEGLENAVRLTDRTMIKELENNIDEWQKATGRVNPEAAKQYIDRLEGRLRKIHDYSVEW